MTELEQARASSAIKGEAKALQSLVSDVAKYVGKKDMETAEALAHDVEAGSVRLGDHVREMACAIREGNDSDHYAEKGGPVPGTAGTPYIEYDRPSMPEVAPEPAPEPPKLPSDETCKMRLQSLHDRVAAVVEGWDAGDKEDPRAAIRHLAEKYSEVFFLEPHEDGPTLDYASIARDGFAWFDEADLCLDAEGHARWLFERVSAGSTDTQDEGTPLVEPADDTEHDTAVPVPVCSDCDFDYCGAEPGGRACLALHKECLEPVDDGDGVEEEEFEDGDIPGTEGEPRPDEDVIKKNVVGIEKYADKFIGKELAAGLTELQAHQMLCDEMPDVFHLADDKLDGTRRAHLTYSAEAGLLRIWRGKLKKWDEK